MEDKLCNELMEDMFDELDGAEEYYKLACEFKENNIEKAQTFKQMALNEITHLTNIHQMIIDELSEEERANMGCYEMLHKRYVKKFNELKKEIESI